jgi:hypothetical protein
MTLKSGTSDRISFLSGGPVLAELELSPESQRRLVPASRSPRRPPRNCAVLPPDRSLCDTEEAKPLAPGTDATLARVEGQLAQQAIAGAEAQTRLQKANGRPDLVLTVGYISKTWISIRRWQVCSPIFPLQSKSGSGRGSACGRRCGARGLPGDA